MSYYSDVAIAMRKADFALLKNEIQNIKDKQEKEITQNTFNRAIIREYPDETILFIRGARWDDYHLECAWLKNEYKKYPHDFIRIGEEIDDIEMNNENFKSDRIQIKRKIDFSAHDLCHIVKRQ